MDALTERLRQAAEALPGANRAADQVRRSAEHARRIRRAVAGSAAAGLLAVVAVGVGVLGGGDRPQLAPPVPASRVWVSPVGGVFTADPVMPKSGWVAMTNGAWGELHSLDAPGAQTLNDDEAIVMSGDMPRPLACITDPYALGADEVHGAALVQPGNQVDAVPLSGRLNEYVLWFADPSDAGRAFDQLREEFQACRLRPDPTYRVDNSYLAYDEGAHPPVEEQFTGEITRVPKNAGGDGYGNGLSVARLGSLVVAHEWLEAPSARPALTLYALTIYALDRLSPAVAPSP
jgi:hypothetical protein